MYISSSAFYEEQDEEVIKMRLSECGITTVAEVKESLRLAKENLLERASNAGAEKRQAKFQLYEFMQKVMKLWVLDKMHAEKDIDWLCGAIQQEIIRLSNAKNRKEQDYQHALSISECASRSELDYRRMQVEWPTKDVVDFAAQAKLANIQLQQDKINGIIKDIVYQITQIEEMLNTFGALIRFLNDADYFCHLEEEL